MLAVLRDLLLALLIPLPLLGLQSRNLKRKRSMSAFQDCVTQRHSPAPEWAAWSPPDSPGKPSDTLDTARSHPYEFDASRIDISGSRTCKGRSSDRRPPKAPCREGTRAARHRWCSLRSLLVVDSQRFFKENTKISLRHAFESAVCLECRNLPEQTVHNCSW